MRSGVAPQTLARGSREVPASAVATPILEWTSARELTGSVLAVGRDVAYLDFRGGVMALTARGVPLMPNGVAVGVDSRREGHGAFCGVLQATDRARCTRRASTSAASTSDGRGPLRRGSQG